MKHILFSVCLSLVIAPWAIAHEGHDHKVMGTVSAIQRSHLEVKGTDGQVSSIVLTDKTKVIRGTTAVTRGDIKAGDRVVAVVAEVKNRDGSRSLVASEVRLGRAAASSEGK